MHIMDQNNEASDVKFDTDTETETSSWKAVKYYKETTTPKIIGWVTKYSGGVIKGERQAEYVLLGLAILMFAVSFYLFFGGIKKAVPMPININNINQSQLGQ